ncbi:MAG: phosphatase PAP2 family protein [Candidatus Peribacteria bacterium]|jgi:membrane-associated phospholipid phosphatase|nr:phosphatase PAP2 family protein [Candidatus Peribacteria bacterium]
MFLLIIPIFFIPTAKYGTNLLYGEGLKMAFALFLLLCVSLCFTLGIAAFTKLFFYKERPIPMPTDTLWKKLNAGTFPSMHTIVATVIAMVVFRGTVELGFPQHVFLIYMIVVVAIALSRIALKKHYPTDVFFGVIYGVVGTFISIYGGMVVLAIALRFLYLYM